MSMTPALDLLPAGARVFLDSNVLIYGLERRSEQCGRLLARCAEEETVGITSTHVLSEATHQLMIGEARRTGLLTDGERNPAKALKSRPTEIQRLKEYWARMLSLLSMNLLVLPVEERTLHAAQAAREEAGLLCNDSIVVACMREFGIHQIATNDLDFARVSGIEIFRPTDLASR